MMPLPYERTSPPITSEQAESLIKGRPDIPNGLVVAARSINPGALALLAKSYPTSDESSKDERERNRRLRLLAVRDIAERAVVVKEALDGAWGDSTRLEVFHAVGEAKDAVELLAWWFPIDERGEVVRPIEWARVRSAAETQKIRAAIFAAHRLCVAVEQQERRRPRRKAMKRRSKKR